MVSSTRILRSCFAASFRAPISSFLVSALFHAAGRTCVGRLHKYRILEVSLYCRNRDIHILFHLRRITGTYFAWRITKGIYDDLCIQLIHGYRGSPAHHNLHTGSFARLRRALNSTVLAMQRAVEHRMPSILFSGHAVLRNEALLCCVREITTSTLLSLQAPERISSTLSAFTQVSLLPVVPLRAGHTFLFIWSIPRWPADARTLTALRLSAERDCDFLFAP